MQGIIVSRVRERGIDVRLKDKNLNAGEDDEFL